MLRVPGHQGEEDLVKVCFVVLAHHQPVVFERLIRTIGAGGADVVVHVDKRSDLEDFSRVRSANIHFVAKRSAVHWSGWTLNRTILETLESALQFSKADYFVLLAGTDLPIRPVRSLLAFLTDRYPANFLNYYPLVPGLEGHDLIDKFYFRDLKDTLADIRSPDRAKLPPIRRLLAGAVSKFEGALAAFLPRRNTSWMRFYRGAARWCLNRNAARYAVDCYRSPECRRLRNHLKLSANSDEIFVQTVVLNSHHREQCEGFCQVEADDIFAGRREPLPDEKSLNLHYVDWSAEREDPAVLVESDFDRLKSSGKYFAYKFIGEVSLPLMERIERELMTDCVP